MLHLELGDARPLLFAGLEFSKPLMPFGRHAIKLIQFSVITRRDEPAVRQHHWRIVTDRPVDKIDEIGLGDQ